MALSVLVMIGESNKWLPDLVERAKQLVVNGGFEKDCDVGPVVSPASKERIESVIKSAGEQGASILLDGRGYRVPKYPSGNFVRSP
jgi:malonate-semialdehyde dehydrogenase (acetylating)/methylmalonate-semialdehyde dehydrogenase